MMRRTLIALAVLVGLLGFDGVSRHAEAQIVTTCTVVMTAISFGTVDPTTASATTTTGTATVTCTAVISLTPSVSVCIGIDAGTGNGSTVANRTMSSGAGSMNYGLYQDSGFTQPIGNEPATMIKVNVPISGTLVGSGSKNVTIYGRLPHQTSAPTGVYSSTLGLKTNNAIIGLSTNCTLILDWTSAVPFDANATVDKACLLNVADLDFGNVGLLTTARQGEAAIRITCTIGTAYRIAIGAGLSGASSPTQRRMRRGTEYVTYGLYRDAGRTLPFGWTTDVDTYSGAATGLQQPVAVFGLVPVQSTPTAGNYSDTVVVTLTY